MHFNFFDFWNFFPKSEEFYHLFIDWSIPSEIHCFFVSFFIIFSYSAIYLFIHPFIQLYIHSLIDFDHKSSSNFVPLFFFLTHSFMNQFWQNFIWMVILWIHKYFIWISMTLKVIEGHKISSYFSINPTLPHLCFSLQIM